jgi:hypothetical protein
MTKKKINKMAISKEQLAAIISGRAKHLCNPEGDRMVESRMRHSSANLDNPDPSMYDSDADAFDAMFTSSIYEERSNSGDIKYNEISASNSKLPEHIKQSMLTERIDVSSLNGGSVLDTLGVKPEQKRRQNKQQVKENIQPQYTPSQASVDYSIIKAIVNECLNEYFSKQQLNESSTLKTIGLNNGTISLVDNKGNVFKAKLEKIGNTNEKK